MKKALVFILLGFFFLQLSITSLKVSAQFQEEPFSANNKSCQSYRCTEINGDQPTPQYNPTTEFCECTYTSGENTLAYLKPPALQQLEVWFVRIVYVVWTIVASFSFLLVFYLAYQWILSQGDVTQIKAMRERIIYYAFGVALVFLALPILTTFFRLLGVNGDVKCYDFDTLPRFQFFFPELCTDPLDLIVSDPCNFTISAEGYACSVTGQQYTCSPTGGLFISYVCSSNRVWEKVEEER